MGGGVVARSPKFLLFSSLLSMSSHHLTHAILDELAVELADPSGSPNFDPDPDTDLDVMPEGDLFKVPEVSEWLAREEIQEVMEEEER